MAQPILRIAFFAALLLPLTPEGSEAQGRFLQSEFLPVGARYLGAGGGHAALPGGAASAYYNPALLPWTGQLEFMLEGNFVTGPTFETDGGLNRLSDHDRGNINFVGIRFPDAGGFSFAILEATKYDHDLRGYLFGRPPEGGTKPTPDGAFAPGKGAADVTDSTILDYQDRVKIQSFGIATGYKGSPNTSFGIAFWVDRKKVFKSLDYQWGISGPPDGNTRADTSGWYDAEATTNDISLHFSAGLYHRLSDKLDGGLVVNTGTDLTSVHQIDEWPNGLATRTSIVGDEVPLTIRTGAAYYWSRTLRFAADAEFQHWSGVEGDYESVVQIGVGAEWDQSERLVLRGGFFTLFDPAKEPEGGYAAALRDVERSGTLMDADEYFLTFGAGWWLTPYLMVDGAIANSDLLSPEDGRTSLLFSLRFLFEPGEEE
ncbi:MAG: hypothetical protein ABIK65_14225 [Candidatus Eisenbacteria bacterium]